MKAGLWLRCLYAWCGDQVACPLDPQLARVEVMTFETVRMRTESQMLLGSQPQLTRVMRAVIAVADLAQSATTATMSLKCWVLR